MTGVRIVILIAVLLLATACGADAGASSPEATPPPTAVYLNTGTYLDPGAPLPTPTMDPFCAEYLAELRQRFVRETGITSRFWGTDATRMHQRGYPGRREMECVNNYLEY